MKWLWDRVQAFGAGLAVNWSRRAIEQRLRRVGAVVAVRAVHAGLGLLIVQSVMVAGFLLANGGLLRLLFAEGWKDVAQAVILLLLGGLYFLGPPLAIWLWGGRLGSWQARLQVEAGPMGGPPAPRP